MSLIQTIEDDGVAAMTAVEHAAAYLVGFVARAKTALNELDAASPMVATAINLGITAATNHGIPVSAIEVTFDAVMWAANALVDGLTQLPKPPTVATQTTVNKGATL